MSLISEVNELIEFFESESSSSGFLVLAADDPMAELQKTLKNLGAKKGSTPPASAAPEPTSNKANTGKRPKPAKQISTEEEDDDTPPPVVLTPLNVSSKIVKTAKLVDTDKVSEYYKNLVKLHSKIETLSSLQDDEDISKLLLKAVAAHNDAVKKLKVMAKDNFPKELEKFGSSAKDKLVESLSEENDGEVEYYFDETNAKVIRLALMDMNRLVYTYRLTLRNVKDDDNFAFPIYVIAVSQVFNDDGSSEFYVTRLLQDKFVYNLGRPFASQKELLRAMNSILNHDSIRSTVDKIVIPFNNEELSERFVHDHVASVNVDKDQHKIVITLKKDATVADAEALVPDFMRNMAEIVNQKKIAIKFHIAKNKSPLQIEFVLIQRYKNKTAISREQLADMKDRYNLSDDAYNELIKFFVVGN